MSKIAESRGGRSSVAAQGFLPAVAWFMVVLSVFVVFGLVMLLGESFGLLLDEPSVLEIPALSML